jgi:hypothetical protein
MKQQNIIFTIMTTFLNKNKYYLDGFNGQMAPGVSVQLTFQAFQGIGLGNI